MSTKLTNYDTSKNIYVIQSVNTRIHQQKMLVFSEKWQAKYDMKIDRTEVSNLLKSSL